MTRQEVVQKAIEGRINWLQAADNTIKLGTVDNGAYHFPGQLDEATIWNRALSQPEIQELMTCGPLR